MFRKFFAATLGVGLGIAVLCFVPTALFYGSMFTYLEYEKWHEAREAAKAPQTLTSDDAPDVIEAAPQTPEEKCEAHNNAAIEFTEKCEASKACYDNPRGDDPLSVRATFENKAYNTCMTDILNSMLKGEKQK